MKLAEALLIRADQQKQIASYKQRIQANVLVQDGDEPSEDPNRLIEQVFALSQQLHCLVNDIHHTNALTRLPDGRSMLQLLSQRDELVERHQILIGAIRQSQQEPDRYSSREIKWTKVISISKLQKQADHISAQLRSLNVLIQASNWQVDLIDSQTHQAVEPNEQSVFKHTQDVTE